MTLVSVAAENAPSKLRTAMPWLKEVAVIGAVYVVYGFVRNQFGSANLRIGDEPKHAFHNARDVISWEKAIGLFHEQTIQRWFLGTPWIKFFNIFYGTAHFIVTLGILIWLFVRRRQQFHRWRTTLMATTVLALIGFALFPLMPPRLFNAYAHECAKNDAGICYRYGGGELAEQQGQPHYHFVDTLREVGGLWSFDSEKLDSVSNQYAAMPSLHFGWSSWCAFVLWPAAGGRRWAQALLVAYPLATLFAITVTANHFWLDAAGGALALAVGYLAVRTLTELRTSSSRRPR